MDLFTAMVRLEAAGWKSGPPGEPLGPPALQRLLRKVSWLESPDGVRYAFDTPPLEDGPFRVHDGTLHAVTDAMWMAVFPDRVRVFERREGWILRAGDLDSLLQTLDRPPAAPVDPTPLLELELEGSGVGWRLDDLEPPVRLGDPPEALSWAPLEVDDTVAWLGQRVRTPGGVREVEPESPDPEEPALDELFGEGGGRPQPRTALIWSLLVSGVFLTVLGMGCIAAPGGILVLLAWMNVEKDVQRLENGYLPASDGPRVELTRRVTYLGLLVVVFLFAVQGLLLCNGFYDVLLDHVYIPIWQELVRRILHGADPEPVQQLIQLLV